MRLDRIRRAMQGRTIVLGMLLCLGAAWFLSADRTALLVPEHEVAALWESEEPHRFRVRVPAGKGTVVQIHQRGVDLVVHVASQGAESFEVDSPTGRHGVEQVFLAAPEDEEDVTLSLRPLGDSRDVNAGYAIRAAPWAPLSSHHLQRARAEARFHQARVVQEDRSLHFHDEADRDFAQAAELFAALGLQERQAQSLFLQGKLRHRGARFQEAVQSYQAALALRERADGQLQLGNALAMLGRWEEAEASLQRALDLYDAQGGSAEATAWQSLGSLHTQQGQFEEALRCLHHAYDMFERTGPRHKRLATLNSLAALHLAQGTPERALIPLHKALDEAEDSDWKTHAKTFELLARAHMRQGALAQAQEGYAESMKLAAGRLPRFEVSLRVGQGMLAQKMGRVAEAEQLYLGAVQASTDMHVPLDSAIARNNLGWLLLGDGRLGEARGQFEAAMADLTSLETSTLRGVLHFGLARVAMEHRQDSLVEEEMEAALRALESLRSQSALPDRDVVMASRHHVFDVYVEWWMQKQARQPGLGFDLRALALAEQSKARTLLDGMAADPVVQKLGGSATRAADTWPAVSMAAVYPSREEVLGEMLRLVDSESRVLSYHLGRLEAFLWVVGPGGIQSFPLGPSKQIEAEVQKIERLMGTRHRPGAKRQLEDALAELARRVLPPATTLDKARRLIVVPSGELLRAPFAALPWSKVGTPDPEGHPGAADRVLLNAFDIVFLPSASVLTASRERSKRFHPEGLAVFADPIYNRQDPRLTVGDVPPPPPEILQLPRLPGSAAEARAVASLLGASETDLYVGSEAGLTTVQAGVLESKRWIHFATHGVAHEGNPELSYLLLSQLTPDGHWQDGQLTARQIAALQLQADLVVLSACHSGPGRPMRGEGLTGLARSFLLAGARRVLVSLWEVDDAAAAVLMEHFYSAMVEGMPAGEALRHAQHQIRQEPQWHDPFYWAGFALFGDWH